MDRSLSVDYPRADDSWAAVWRSRRHHGGRSRASAALPIEWVFGYLDEGVAPVVGRPSVMSWSTAGRTDGAPARRRSSRVGSARR